MPPSPIVTNNIEKHAINLNDLSVIYNKLKSQQTLPKRQ
jgi:hypothetical protein